MTCRLWAKDNEHDQTPKIIEDFFKFKFHNYLSYTIKIFGDICVLIKTKKAAPAAIINYEMDKMQ